MPFNYRRVVPAAGAVVVLAAAAGLLLIGLSPAPSPSTGRYYVVPADGDYLFRIAATTLGDGRRYPEVYELNRDRIADPARLEPGWVLVLPADARGPGVHSGSVPAAALTGGKVPAPGPATAVWIAIGAALAGTLALLRLRRRRPAPVAETTPSRLEFRLDCITDRLDVRLRDAGDGAYRWIEDNTATPIDVRLPVVLGRHGSPRLVLDLARVPDLLTVSGDPAARRRQALEIARQAHRAGAAVIVVGDALGDDVPDEYRRRADYPGPEVAAEAPALVVSAGLGAARLRIAKQLAAGSAVIVPMLVGDVVRSRWSIAAEPVSPPDPAPRPGPAARRTAGTGPFPRGRSGVPRAPGG